jgi:hypothetical protein
MLIRLFPPPPLLQMGSILYWWSDSLSIPVTIALMGINMVTIGVFVASLVRSCNCPQGILMHDQGAAAIVVLSVDSCRVVPFPFKRHSPPSTAHMQSLTPAPKVVADLTRLLSDFHFCNALT